jgi:hypothetical protein
MTYGDTAVAADNRDRDLGRQRDVTVDLRDKRASTDDVKSRNAEDAVDSSVE